MGFYSDAPIILMGIQCSGSEEEFIDCTSDGYGIFSCDFVAVAYCEGERVLLSPL